MMRPPDSSFHSQTRSRNSSRPRSRRSDLPLPQLALDHHLGRDAGMVDARLPEHVAAAHALEAAEHVLDRVVERVAHMQRAGDVRRRDDDRVGLAPRAIRAPGLEGLGLVPAGGDARLDGGGIERLVHHREYYRQLVRQGATRRGKPGGERRAVYINELRMLLPGKPANFPTDDLALVAVSGYKPDTRIRSQPKAANECPVSGREANP